MTLSPMQKLRSADKNVLTRRKRSADGEVTSAIKQARDKLSGNQDISVDSQPDLLIVYARNYSAALFITLLLVVSTSLALVLAHGLSVVIALGWISLQFVIHAMMLNLCRRICTSDPKELQVQRRRRQILTLCLGLGVIWTALIGYLSLTGASQLHGPILFGFLLIYVAKFAQIGPSIRYSAIAACLLPVLAFSATMALEASIVSIIMALILPGAMGFVIATSNRLMESHKRDIEVQMEKDALIAGLETARVMSESARAQAEDANLAKSRFLAAMSHELRTPLNAILGFSEVMSKQMLGPIENESYLDYSKDIHNSGSHLLSLINEILDLSRIEAGRYQLREEQVYLHEIAHDAMHMVEMRASAKDLDIATLLQPDLPRVWADEKAIRQILLNLLTNAVKFTPKGGRIELKLGWTATGGQYFSISDNGPGIPEDEIAVVLSPFGQGSIAIDAAEAGTGLGLPIVRAMVKLHDGHFDLKSELRKGTTVTVMLPAKRVMQDMPAYTGADGREKLAQKNARIMNVGATPKSQTPLPAHSSAPETSDSPQDDAMRARMERMLKSDR
ncbi:MAG: HAMP domain-containing sensor histidine kinase [Pseudomonadota bacterium]